MLRAPDSEIRPQNLRSNPHHKGASTETLFSETNSGDPALNGLIKIPYNKVTKKEDWMGGAFETLAL